MKGWPQIKITHKIFLSLTLVTGVALGLLALITWRALDQGFLDYVSQLDEERSARLKVMLRMEYVQAGESWERLAEQPERWHMMIRAAEDNQDISSQLRSGNFQERGRRPPRRENPNTDRRGAITTEEEDPWDRLGPPPRREDDRWDRPPRRGDGPPRYGDDRPPRRGERRRGDRPPPRWEDSEDDPLDFEDPFGFEDFEEPPPRRKGPGRRGDGQDPMGPIGGRLSVYDAEEQMVIGPRHGDNNTSEGSMEAIPLRGKSIGYLHIAPRQELTEPQDIAFLNKLGKELLWVTLALLSLAAIVGIFLARQLVRPLRHLAVASRKLSAGTFTTRVPQKGRDEIAMLSRDFNNLALTLEENEEARQRWTADISHELRTPLAVLRAEIEAVKDGIRKPDEKNLDSLLNEVQHLSKIVSDLYELSLADIGALTYHKQIVDIYEILEQVASAFRARIKDQGLSLHLDTPGEAFVFADPDRLHQLFTNFIENSCRYTDSPGSITIKGRVINKTVVISIDDTPPAPASCDHLFSRLYREEESRNRAKGGAGLGLALCRNIIEAHEGTIKAYPSEMGGLCLSITLTIAEES